LTKVSAGKAFSKNVDNVGQKGWNDETTKKNVTVRRELTASCLKNREKDEKNNF